MLMHSRSPRYCAYVLRCSEEAGRGDHAPAAWRFSLEDTSSGVRRAFADIDALTSFLQSELAGGCDEPAPHGGAPRRRNAPTQG